MNNMYDVVIVGAGPAGLSAAISCRKHDLNVLVIDEFPKAGGRLLGQLHQEPNGEWWNGVRESEKLLEQAQALDVTIKNGVPVYHVENTDEYFIVHTEKTSHNAKQVLIAAGAAETAAPLPGWTLAGVM